ncbi:MAG: hypothetical protein WEE66_02050 [Actinomycetota bacterium]
MDFAEALDRYGFRREHERRGQSELYTAQPNRFLTHTVHAYEDGSAIFSWEFALGEYLSTKGIQVGSDETLNQFAYPRVDDRGRQDGAWLAAVIERAEGLLAEVRLDRPGG